MNRSLTKCQFVAFGAGVLICGVLVAAGGLLEYLYNGNEYLRMGADLMVVLVLPVVFAFALAVYAGRHEKVVYITCAVPALALLFTDYLMWLSFSIHCAARHSMGSIVIGGPNFLIVLLWVLFTGLAGIGFKRLYLRGKTVPEKENVPSLYPLWFPIFLGVIVVLMIVGVGIYSHYLTIQNSPPVRILHAGEILHSPNASESMKLNALMDIHRIPTEESTRLFQEAVKEQTPPLNILAAIYLVERGDPSPLPVLEPILMKSGKLPLTSGFVRIDFALSHIKNPETIPTLTRLMKSSDPKVREGAANALRGMKNNSATPALISGLYDDDSEVRYHSLMGLYENQNNDQAKESWGPTFKTFEQNEAHYLDHWKEWAKTWKPQETNNQ
ncbi:MAG: HEAT repeat domain-containing protein [Chthoniobacterales bacterium]